MDEILEVVELLSDLGLEETFGWLIRIAGVLAMIAGLGLWIFGDMSFLYLPAALTIGGLILVAIPEILLQLVELA